MFDVLKPGCHRRNEQGHSETDPRDTADYIATHAWCYRQQVLNEETIGAIDV